MIYAAKIERVVSNTKNAMLFWESKLMHKLKGKTQVPQVFFIGTDQGGKNVFHKMAVMVMEMLGPSLIDLHNKCK